MTHTPDNFIEPQLRLDHVGFLRGERWILEDISWQVMPGQTAAIIGPNGSGKSTIGRLLMGYLWPSRGKITVDGQVFGETDLHELRRTVRMVQPSGQFDIEPYLTVREAVLTGVMGSLGLFESVSQTDRIHANEWINTLGINPVAHQPYETLSTGERVRTLIARALISHPKLLILDEPTTGLDIRAREELVDTLETLSNQPQCPSIVIMTHHIEELPNATSNILLMNNGRIAAKGQPVDVLCNEELSKVFGCPIRVKQSNGRFAVEVSSRQWI